MAYTLTSHYDKVIERLIRAGHFGNRSEVVRAGLRKLGQGVNLGADYLRPPPLPPGTLARAPASEAERATKSVKPAGLPANPGSLASAARPRRTPATRSWLLIGINAARHPT